MQAVAVRLVECGLTMHPEKSRIVYCQDSNRIEFLPHVQFTFLGFTFRPRKAMSKQRRVFTSFLPGVSADALKRMCKVVRGWRIPRQTPALLAELAEQYNSVIRGWWEYYGSFYQTAMRGLFRYVDRKLEQWARRKYKAVAAQAAQRGMARQGEGGLSEDVRPMECFRDQGWITRAV